MTNTPNKTTPPDYEAIAMKLMFRLTPMISGKIVVNNPDEIKHATWALIRLRSNPEALAAFLDGSGYGLQLPKGICNLDPSEEAFTYEELVDMLHNRDWALIEIQEQLSKSEQSRVEAQASLSKSEQRCKELGEALFFMSVEARIVFQETTEAAIKACRGEFAVHMDRLEKECNKSAKLLARKEAE